MDLILGFDIIHIVTKLRAVEKIKHTYRVKSEAVRKMCGMRRSLYSDMVKCLLK